MNGLQSIEPPVQPGQGGGFGALLTALIWLPEWPLPCVFPARVVSSLAVEVHSRGLNLTQGLGPHRPFLCISVQVDVPAVYMACITAGGVWVGIADPLVVHGPDQFAVGEGLVEGEAFNISIHGWGLGPLDRYAGACCTLP